VNIVPAGDVATDNQNNNAVTQRDSCEPAALTDSDTDHDSDSDSDGMMDSRQTESSLRSCPSDPSKASDRSPRQKKKKSLERLTQIRQEEVNSACSLSCLPFSKEFFGLKVAVDQYCLPASTLTVVMHFCCLL